MSTIQTLTIDASEDFVRMVTDVAPFDISEATYAFIVRQRNNDRLSILYQQAITVDSATNDGMTWTNQATWTITKTGVTGIGVRNGYFWFVRTLGSIVKVLGEGNLEVA